MKKITLLMMLFVASIGINAQSWDFNTQTDWVGGAGGTLEGTTFSWIAGRKPKIEGNDHLGVDATTNKILAITITNDTEITEIKLRHLKPDGTVRYVSFTIKSFNPTSRIEYFDLTNDLWTGTQDEIDFIFSIAGSATTSASSLTIEKIEFIASVPQTEKNSYTFDDGSDGFAASSGSFVWSQGILTFTPIVDRYARIEQKVYYYVDATSNKTVNRIFLSPYKNHKWMHLLQ
jgi:hypothetical protein